MEPHHEDSLSTAFSTEIRPFIDVIDTLRSFGIQEDVALPNVVVVGDQSSGKSSIIEALSGVQLPRGKGIVTRCPLELQLKRVLGARWVAKLTYHSSNDELIENIIHEPSEVEEFIREAQNDICGIGKGVSKKLITLRIESPAESAPDLTLIDLPGIARIALADQPKDICEQIRRIILSYVKPANTVILCVISAFLDIAVNESIKIATEVDPKGERTIGVITKPDLADESQKPEVLCILNNERINLMKGFSMVKCRSQNDLDDNIPLETSTENEKIFFENDDIYRRANKNQLGTMNLASKISEELVEVIKTNLPQLKANIAHTICDSQRRLNNLPEGVPDTIHEKKTYLSNYLWSLNAEVKELLNNGVLKTRECNIFQKWRDYTSLFAGAVGKKNKHAIEVKLKVEKLTDLIAKSRGREMNYFLKFELFEREVSNLIATYETDAKDMAKSVNTMVQDSILELINNTFKHLPAVEREMKGILNQESRKCYESTLSRILFVFKQEKYAFTMDSNFERELEKLKKKNQKEQSEYEQESIPEFNKGSAKSLHNLIQIYLKIAERRICDVVPLTIHHCSMIELNEQLHRSFLEFSNSPGVEDKITENQRVKEERRLLLEKMERLHKAQAELIKF